MPLAMPSEAMAAVRRSAGARRPTAPTRLLMPVPLTPRPSIAPLIRRSSGVAAANIINRPSTVQTVPVTTTLPAP